MSILDIPQQELTEADCYQRYTNPAAVHQLRLRWAKGHKTTCAVSCNCGTSFTERRPELSQMQAIRDEYALHVMEVLIR